MSNLSPTAANVKRVSGSIFQKTAGAAVVRGDVCYLKASDGKAYLGQCDGTTEEAEALYMALNDAAADQPVTLQKGGEINLGAILTVGVVYVLSATAGKIAPLADLVSTNKLTIVGTARTTSILRLSPNAPGGAVA
jgi:hypothetical protein